MNVKRRWHDEKGPYIKPISRTKVHFLNPSPNEIKLSDVAWHLAKINRYNGGTLEHYSVAEHSILMAQWFLQQYDEPRTKSQVEENVLLAKYALTHDADEYLFGDFIAPIKPYLGGFELIEHKFKCFLLHLFGLRPEIPSIVDKVDKAICGLENEVLRFYPEPDFECNIELVRNIAFHCWEPEKAADEYKQFFSILFPDYKDA